MGKGFVDYSIPNGDRDIIDLDDEEFADNEPIEIVENPSVLPKTPECDNLVIKKISNNQLEGKRVAIDTIKIPRAFDLDYYQNKIDIANQNHDRSGAVRAVAIKNFADIVYQFYSQVMFVFYKKHNMEMPDYISLREKVPCDIDSLAQAVVEKEKYLFQMYDSNFDKLNSHFSSRKHLTELKQFSAQAWMMYYNLKTLNDFVGFLKYAQKNYDSADLNNPSHIANLYGLHTQAEYYLEVNIQNFFSIYKGGLLPRKQPSSKYFYQDMDGITEFDEILKETNAYQFKDHVEEFKTLKDKIPQDTIEKRVIGFYNHYKDMKYIKHCLRYIISKEKMFDINVDPYIYADSNNSNEKLKSRNLFKVGLKYYKTCKEMVQNLPIKSRIYRDVCDMCVELEEILIKNQDLYILTEEKIKEADKKFEQEFPHLAKKEGEINPKDI